MYRYFAGRQAILSRYGHDVLAHPAQAYITQPVIDAFSMSCANVSRGNIFANRRHVIEFLLRQGQGGPKQ